MIRAGEGTTSPKRQDSKTTRNNKNRTGFLLSSHPLTNFEIQRYYKDES